MWAAGTAGLKLLAVQSSSRAGCTAGLVYEHSLVGLYRSVYVCMCIGAYIYSNAMVNSNFMLNDSSPFSNLFRVVELLYNYSCAHLQNVSQGSAPFDDAIIIIIAELQFVHATSMQKYS